MSSREAIRVTGMVGRARYLPANTASLRRVSPTLLNSHDTPLSRMGRQKNVIAVQNFRPDIDLFIFLC